MESTEITQRKERMKQKNLLLISIFSLLLIGTFGSVTFAQQSGGTQKYKVAGVGFSFGIIFEQHQKSNFKAGNGNYFRISIAGEDDSLFFMHSEESTFNIEEGDAVANGQKNVHGIGGSLDLGEGLAMDVMVGGANVIIPGATTAAGPEAISSTRSTDAIGELAVKWGHLSGRLAVNVFLSYRYHKLGNSVEVTDSGGETRNINELSSTNIGIDMGISF